MGSGFRTFTAGEVLTASNVNNYLMEQSVMVFGGSAARSSAIGTANFEEGMTSYLTDTDKLEAYDGTNWVAIGPATSTQGLTLISTVTFSGVSSQLFTNVFSATYDAYKIQGYVTHSTSANAYIRLRTGSTDLTTGYANQYLIGASTTASAALGATDTFMSLNGTQTGSFHLDCIMINPFASLATQSNTWVSQSTNTIRLFSTFTTSTSSYESFNLYPSTGTISGKVSVYGFNL